VSIEEIIVWLEVVPRQWYQWFDKYVVGQGFIRSEADHCVYFKQEGNNFIILVLYVDDIILISDCKKLVKETKSQLSCEFDMKDLGELHYCLGIEVKRDHQNKKLYINQRKYVENILELFRMDKCK
jgi:hypothetical protein